MEAGFRIEQDRDTARQGRTRQGRAGLVRCATEDIGKGGEVNRQSTWYLLTCKWKQGLG